MSKHRKHNGKSSPSAAQSPRRHHPYAHKNGGARAPPPPPPQPPSTNTPHTHSDGGGGVLSEVEALRRKDYFSRLGVARAATKDDITRAYRKLSLRYHPDKNKNDDNAAAIFTLINEARDVLADDTRRLVYLTKLEMGEQTLGTAEVNSGRPYAGTMGDSSTLAKLRKSLSADGHHRWGPNNVSMPARLKAPDKVLLVRVTLEQLDAGVRLQQPYKKLRCVGLSGNIEYNYVAVVDIKPGSFDGERIVHKGAGDEFPGMEAGDLVFLLEQRPHPLFKRRDGANLWLEWKINPLHMYLGTTCEFVTVYGAQISGNCAPPLTPNKHRRFPGTGMRIKSCATGDPDDSRGDVYVKFVLDDNLSELSLEQLHELQEAVNKQQQHQQNNKNGNK